MVTKTKKSVDVRSKKDVKELEQTIKIGPITIILIYADWCGHCTRFKENVWNTLLSKSRKAKLASIHFDQLQNTSLKDVQMKGYPTVLVVGNDGQPASFPISPMSTETTNAMPETDLETLELLADADANSIMRTGVRTPEVATPQTATANTATANTATANTATPQIATANTPTSLNTTPITTLTPEDLENPPDTRRDVMRGGNMFRLLSNFVNHRKTSKNKKRHAKKTRRAQ
jgi:thioredoxin-like negative regulator of GroEL